MADKVLIPGGRRFLFTFFTCLILGGSLLLALPWSWTDSMKAPGYVDCLFISCSAVSVTGLCPVNTELLSPFGQVILLLLIQAGGLGIISITSLVLLSGRDRMSMSRHKLVGDYFLPGLEFNPRKILLKVLGYTFFVEAAGTLVLWPWLLASGRPLTQDAGPSLFSALFHSVSAFCNAGFSIYGDGLNQFSRQPGVFLPLAALIIVGGIGFVVMEDIRRFVSRRKPHLQLYTKLMLLATAILLVLGTLGYALLEWNQSLAVLDDSASPLASRILKAENSFFMATSPRTAGFDTIPPAQTGLPTQILTMLLMFIGGGAGSTAGGLKVVTFFVLVILLARGLEESGDLRIGHRQISGGLVNRSMVLFIRMAGLLFLFVSALGVTEYVWGHKSFPLSSLVFETISAFSTVGLSTGITSSLTDPGKVVIILTMFAGRVGVAALAMPRLGKALKVNYTTPREDILL